MQYAAVSLRQSGNVEMIPGVDVMLRIVGADENNLRHIDCEIPRGCLVAITGPSGSGKSSLLFDTIYREARYHFLRAAIPSQSAKGMRLPRAAVKEIDGLSLAIGVDASFPPMRSQTSFASFAGLYAHVRLLFRHFACTVCPGCNSDVRRSSMSDILTYFRGLEEGTRIRVLAPISRETLVDGETLQERLVESSIHRVVLSDEHIRVESDSFVSAMAELQDLPEVQVSGLVDSFRSGPDTVSRCIEAVELALAFSSGVVALATLDSGDEDLWCPEYFQTEGNCNSCGYELPSISSNSFSYYRKGFGCNECQGYGDIDGRTCSRCHGARLDPVVLSRRLFGASLSEVLLGTVDFVASWSTEALRHLDGRSPIQYQAFTELDSLLEILKEVDLAYLTLSRALVSLSSGELQRARIAREIRQSMAGVLYCLDEPSAGLHPHDVARMMSVLRNLSRRGASVLFIDHDPGAITAADFVLELGPGSGVRGGALVAAAPISEFLKGDSLTARWIQSLGPSTKQTAEVRPEGTSEESVCETQVSDTWFSCHGVSKFTLSLSEVSFPCGAHTVVVGRSGSGKSTLLRSVLGPALRCLLNKKNPEASLSSEERRMFGVSRIDAWSNFKRVVDIGDIASVRNKRSTVATLSNVLKPIRDLFSMTLDARVRGYTSAHFSFNSTAGRCPECRGEGSSLHVLEDVAPVEELCSLCRGERYRREVLDVRYKGLNIVDALSLSIREALELFSNIPRLGDCLAVLEQSGLGYLSLNQRSDTLSTGELQRVRLSREISESNKSQTLYIFDEPSRGLHAAEVSLLNDIFARLLESGSTILTIEHNSQVVRAADYVVALGVVPDTRGETSLTCGSVESVAPRVGFDV